jgi:hypothetical protein
MNRPTITLGVTGHRVLTDLDRIIAGVDSALARIETAFPGAAWQVASALAEGADRVVVARVLERDGTRLKVVLPVPADDYVNDFKTPESQSEFRNLLDRAACVVELPRAARRSDSYEAAGLYVLEHSDVLIVIWDGKVEQGTGGTGAIARQARERGLPIAWVHAGNRVPGTLEPSSLGSEQGRVTIENFP